MFTAAQFWSFTATSVVLLLIPGPSVMFTVTRGIAYGRRAAIVTMLGNQTGTCVHVLAVTFGIGALVARSVAVFNVVKIAGAVYLVYLGVHAIRHRRELHPSFGGRASSRSFLTLFRDGFLVGVSNPKTTLFFVAALPQFVVPANGHVQFQLLLLGLLFVALACVTDGVYGLAAGSVGRWLTASPRRGELVGVASGVAIIGLGARLAFTGRHD